MAKVQHRAVPFRSPLSGVEAVSIASARSFPRHAHDSFGIGLIREGAQHSWSLVGEVEGVAGDVILVNPGEMHDGTPIGEGRVWSMLYLEPDRLADCLRDAPGLTGRSGRPVIRHNGLAAAVSRLFACITSPHAQPDAAEEALLICLESVFGHHAMDGGPIREAVSCPAIDAALQRIEDAPDEPVSLAELAVLCSLSRFQLLRAFARQTGTTPHAYRLQWMVRMARRHLRSGYALADAALMAGFADQSHMTRAFQRQFGITPGRYRAAVLPQ